VTKLRKTLFPEPSRDFIGMRWGNIILRTLHLIGVTLFTGALLTGAELSLWQPWFDLSWISGLLLIALFCYASCNWIIQLRGVLILLKLLLLYLFWDHPQLLMVIIVVVVAISSIVAHAPGKVRYFFVIPKE
jgi:hypothetical protein